MRTYRLNRFLLSACLGGFWLAPLLASACSVPVFRYALERWGPDAYELVVFHQQPLAPQEQALLDAWNKVAENGLANLTVEKVAISTNMPAPRQALWKAQTNATLPWLVVLYPSTREPEAPVWAGPLNAEVVKTLVDSPARRELANRLSKGVSAVWLLLESGQAARDQAVASMLETESRNLEKSLQLPEAAPDDPKISGDVPLKISFATLRVSRTQPAEQMLVNMLVNIAPEIARATDPMVFGVFGRGRALPPLIGKDITNSVLGEVAEFLTGACSCQVKSMNPGFDLLLAADWEAALEGRVVKDLELPPLVGMAQFAPPPTNKAPPIATTNIVTTPPESSPLFGNLRWVMILGALVLVLGTIVLMKMPKEKR